MTLKFEVCHNVRVPGAEVPFSNHKFTMTTPGPSMLVGGHGSIIIEKERMKEGKKGRRKSLKVVFRTFAPA